MEKIVQLVSVADGANYAVLERFQRAHSAFDFVSAPHSSALNNLVVYLTNETACECVYDQRRQKPGLKAGAIENINRRLGMCYLVPCISFQHLTNADVLEQRLEDLDRNVVSRDKTAIGPVDVRGCVYHASILVANHLRDAVGVDSPHNVDLLRPNSSIPEADLHCQQPLPIQGRTLPQRGDSRSNKRRRVDSPDGQSDLDRPRSGELPSRRVLNAVTDKYFATIHHWIPMLHERRFRARMDDMEDSRNLKILFHAIIATTLKHVNPHEVGLDSMEVDDQIRASTAMVITHALDGISVENAQSLIMLCFERMGSGDWPKVWSILGSLTRTVDYLQMTVEPGEARPRPLLPPFILLGRPTSNAESEERKRVRIFTARTLSVSKIALTTLPFVRSFGTPSCSTDFVRLLADGRLHSPPTIRRVNFHAMAAYGEEARSPPRRTLACGKSLKVRESYRSCGR